MTLSFARFNYTNFFLRQKSKNQSPNKYSFKSGFFFLNKKSPFLARKWFSFQSIYKNYRWTCSSPILSLFVQMVRWCQSNYPQICTQKPYSIIKLINEHLKSFVISKPLIFSFSSFGYVGNNQTRDWFYA